MKKTIYLQLCFIFLCSGLVFSQKDTLYTNRDSTGYQIQLMFTSGKYHNHPLLAVWIEDTVSNYIETLFVPQSVATGIFKHGDATGGSWKPGFVRRPAALPYWSHQRGIQAEDGLFMPSPTHPVPDALTGPTPKADFVLKTHTSKVYVRVFKVLLEINQPWDWNDYWTNNKYPDDEQYKTSSQPSLIYEVTINLDDPQDEYLMKPVGHGHYAGKTGELFNDLSSLSTALEIYDSIVVKVQSVRL